MPVTVSNLALSVLIDHEGVIRRSDEVTSEVTRSGTSAIVAIGWRNQSRVEGWKE